MALQINRTLTTRSGFPVASGAYCWLQEERAKDRKYSVQVDLKFFKDKAAFDAGSEPFNPAELPNNLFNFYQEFTAANFAVLTETTIHNFVKAQLEAVLGASTINIVQ